MSLNSNPKSEKNEHGFNGFISLGRACCYSTDPKLLNIYINTFNTPFSSQVFTFASGYF